MTKLTFESGIPIVANLQQPIHDAESIAEVAAKFVLSNLHLPAVKIFAVEQRLPVCVIYLCKISRRVGHGSGAKTQQAQQGG